MTRSTYKGDSPNKKISRSFAWMFVFDMMKAMSIKPQAAVVLAGDGGDLSVIRGAAQGAGFDEHDLLYNTVAIDRDIKSVTHCVNKHQCQGRVGEAADILPTLKPYNLSHMDFCNGFTMDNLRTVEQAVSNAQVPSFHLVTIMRGREPDCDEHSFFDGALPRDIRRRMQVHLRKQFGQDYPPAKLLSSGTFNARQAIEWTVDDLRSYLGGQGGQHEDRSDYFDHKGRLTSYGSGMVRVNLFTDCLAVLRPDIGIHRLFANSYQSTTKKSRGTPLVTFGFMAVPVYQGVDEMVEKYITSVARKHPISGWNATLHHGSSAGHAELVRMAMLYADNFGNNVAANLLDVTPGTIAAWKAHRTMGTYSNQTQSRVANS